jgi:hypothetical protein
MLRFKQARLTLQKESWHQFKITGEILLPRKVDALSANGGCSERRVK